MNNTSTLAKLVTALADHEPRLKRLRDELEKAKRRNIELHSLVGAAAIATGERKPHPAVTVQLKCKERVGYTPVKIKEDLSPWRSDGNKRAISYADCIAAPGNTSLCKGCTFVAKHEHCKSYSRTSCGFVCERYPEL